MALTVGSGPFSQSPGGQLNFGVETPTGSVLFWDPVPQRIRGFFRGRALVDSTRAHLLHETGHLPVYYFREEDVRRDLLEPSETRTRCPHKGEARYWSIRVGNRTEADAVWGYPEPLPGAPFLAGHVAFYWDRMDEWFAEDEQILGHPRDPYHRIDVYRTTKRVRVRLGSETLADSVRAKVLFETGVPPRYYFPPEDVRLDLLEASPTTTRCAYKGAASCWHVVAGGERREDLAWSYPAPQHDAEPVRDLICFYAERLELSVE